MIRAILFIVKAAILVAIAVWLVTNPGSVEIVWQGYVIETSVGILLLAIAIVVAVAALLYRLWRGLRHAPSGLRNRRRASRRERGYRALTQGMVAVAAGDADAARRAARRADMLLDEPPLTMLLSAQAAQLNGDEEAARNYFIAMLDRSETSFLGVRGLLTQAIKSGNRPEALRLARRSHDLRPKTPWVLGTLFDLEARAGEWSKAEATLKEATKAGVIAAETARHHRAALLLERSYAADLDGRAVDARELARRAHDLVPGWAPAAVRLSRLLNHAGKTKPAAKAIERAWRVAPHPDLADAYGEIGGADPLARVKRFERLQALDTNTAEGHLALARAAIDAKLWGTARNHLNKALAREPDVRVYRLFAELEQAEHGGGAAAREWLAKAADAPPAVAWVCLECGSVAHHWRGTCGNCGAFDSLAWKTPTNGLPSATADQVTGLPTLVGTAVPVPAVLPPSERRSATQAYAAEAVEGEGGTDEVRRPAPAPGGEAPAPASQAGQDRPASDAVRSARSEVDERSPVSS